MRRKARVEVEILRIGIEGQQSFWFVLHFSLANFKVFEWLQNDLNC